MSSELNKDILPVGECPLWIHVGHHVETEELLNFIKSKIDKNKSVTVFENNNQATNNWIKKGGHHQNWKCQDHYGFHGCEASSQGEPEHFLKKHFNETLQLKFNLSPNVNPNLTPTTLSKFKPCNTFQVNKKVNIDNQ